MRGDEYDWDLNIGLSQFFLQLQPAQSRQPNIQDQTTRCIGSFTVQEVMRRPEQFHAQSYRPDQAFEHLLDRSVVIDYEYCRKRLSHPTLSAVGRLKRKAAPGDENEAIH